MTCHQPSFSVNNLRTLLPGIGPVETATRHMDDVLVFPGEGCPLSNFYKHDIELDNNGWFCNKQFYQHSKAVFFKCHDIAAEILVTKSGLECKWLWDRIRMTGPIKDRWHSIALWAMEQAANAKFSQPWTYPSTHLASTVTKYIAEGRKNNF